MEITNGDDLKKELNERLSKGENPYSVALYGIAIQCLLNTRERFDLEYLFFLKELNLVFLPKLDSKGADAVFLKLLALYYLLNRNLEKFTETIQHLPELSQSQEKVILDWSRDYVMSIFEMSLKNNCVVYTDVQSDQEYTITQNTAELGLFPDKNDSIKLLALIVPIEDGYLSTPPIVFPVDELAFARLKKLPVIDDLDLYENILLCACSRYLSGQFPGPIQLDLIAKELDPDEFDFAKRLLNQSNFFNSFDHCEQAENLLVRIIQTMPQMFHKYSNAYELLESLRLLFIDGKLEDDDLKYSSGEVSTFWYAMIHEYLPEEVKLIKPCIMRPGFNILDFPSS